MNKLSALDSYFNTQIHLVLSIKVGRNTKVLRFTEIAHITKGAKKVNFVDKKIKRLSGVKKQFKFQIRISYHVRT